MMSDKEFLDRVKKNLRRDLGKLLGYISLIK